MIEQAGKKKGSTATDTPVPNNPIFPVPTHEFKNIKNIKKYLIFIFFFQDNNYKLYALECFYL